MGEREFLIYLDPETRLCRYRHYHVWQGTQIVEFRIQLEITVAGVLYGAQLFVMTQHMENLTVTFCTQMADKPKNGLKDFQLLMP